MKKLPKRFILLVAISGLLIAGNRAQADPVGDFFKRLGDSIVKAGKRPDKAAVRPKKRSTKKTGEDLNAQPDSHEEATIQEPADSISPSPTQPSIQIAAAAPAAKGKRGDVPYGIPVPGKEGFVTSPYAPDAGFVDVRKFAPGTEVKDPYTGKTFLTP